MRLWTTLASVQNLSPRSHSRWHLQLLERRTDESGRFKSPCCLQLQQCERGSPGQSDLSICFMSGSSPLGCSFPISARSVHSSYLASREGPISCYCRESAKRLPGCKTEVWRLCAVQLQQQESALNFLAKKLHQHQHPGGKAYKRINLVCYWFEFLECRYIPVYLDEVIEDVHAVGN